MKRRTQEQLSLDLGRDEAWQRLPLEARTRTVELLSRLLRAVAVGNVKRGESDEREDSTVAP
jgi:hypothetical protein